MILKTLVSFGKGWGVCEGIEEKKKIKAERKELETTDISDPRLEGQSWTDCNQHTLQCEGWVRP